MIELIQILTTIRFPDWISEDIISIGPITLKWYGVGYVVGLFSAYLYAARVAETPRYWRTDGLKRARERVPTREDLSDLMFYAFLGIVLGGRLGYILFYSTSTLWEAPLDVFKVWDGGMSFHGGFLGVCAAVGYAAWRKNVSYMRFADLAWIGAPIGLGLVRIANFINQELWGRPTDVPWAMIFPKDPDAVPRHPSQLYEAFLEGLALWIILRILTTRKGLAKPGLITGAGVAGYGIFRFAVEFVREPDRIEQFGLLTRGMAYSLPMVIVGLGVMIWAARRQPVDPDDKAKVSLPPDDA